MVTMRREGPIGIATACAIFVSSLFSFSQTGIAPVWLDLEAFDRSLAGVTIYSVVLHLPSRFVRDLHSSHTSTLSYAQTLQLPFHLDERVKNEKKT